MSRICKTFLALALAAGPAAAAERTITLLATTDLHGNLYPVDYYSGKPAARGLAKIATLVREARAQSPDSLLIDCGDTIEGTPLESLWQQYITSGSLPLGVRFAGPAPRQDPMMAAMNALGYAAMATGNHEFNFGLTNVSRARAEARFPWLAANIETEPGSGVKPFDPYLVVMRGGIRIAIVGLTTPAIPGWEEPAHIRGYRFTDAVEAARRTVAAVRAKEHPDLIVAAVHAGLGSRDVPPHRGSSPPENMVYRAGR